MSRNCRRGAAILKQVGSPPCTDSLRRSATNSRILLQHPINLLERLHRRRVLAGLDARQGFLADARLPCQFVLSQAGALAVGGDVAGDRSEDVSGGGPATGRIRRRL